jgi:hypothetical protein
MALAFRTQSRQTLYVPGKDPSGLLSPEDNIAAEVGQLETSLRQGRSVKFFSRTQRSVISKPADIDPPGSNYRVPQPILTIPRRGET